jgi:O-antigen/teichoic acid export membrane protein
MSLLKKNIAANFAGNIWQTLMSLAFIPLYIKFMGVESYGLIGVFATLQVMFGLLDMGLRATLTRELARLSVVPGKEQEMRNLLRSLEIIYWLIAIFIGIIILVISPFFAHHWIKPGQLSPQIIERAFRIMGFAMALQWPASLYSGGLMGLQKQVLLNVINIGVGTLRGMGAVLILWLISPTIQAFFSWQIIISIISTCLLAFFLWHRLPRTEKKAYFQKHLLAEVWRFAAGMSGISILATILTQLDKIILSKMLTLEMFGYYTLAGVVAMSLYRLIFPVFYAVYPRFTQLVSLADRDALIQLYHKSCQFISVLILPITAVVVTFSYEIMLIWTQNPVTAEKTHLLVSILMCGTALNGLMNIPYGLQLAHGWTRLAFFANLIAIIILVPMIVFMTSYYGALGGASVWVILNSGYVLISIHFMHKRLLPSDKWAWYLYDVGIPGGGILAIVLVARFLLRIDSYTLPWQIITLGGIWSIAVLTGLALAPAARKRIFSSFLKKRTCKNVCAETPSS